MMRSFLWDIAKNEITEPQKALATAKVAAVGALNLYFRLAEAEMRALRFQRDALSRLLAQSPEERRAVALERRAAALRRRDELRALLKNEAGREEKQAASREAHAQRWAAVYCELALCREGFAHILSCSTAAASRLYFSDAVDKWPVCKSVLQRVIGMLMRSEHITAPALSTHLLCDQLERVGKAHVQAIFLLDRERRRRRGLCVDAAELFKDREQLLSWCVEQRRTLETLQNLADLNEFCVSFMANVSVMDTNFLVLLDRGQRLALNKAIRAALVEVNRAWMELSVALFYRISQAIDKERSACNVETACRWWTEKFAPRLKVILAEAKTVASHHFMESRPAMKEINERSVTFLRSLVDSQVLLRHISDFTERKSCLEPHEEALRAVLLSPLSILTQTFSGNAKYDGQQEYADRLSEISEWIDAQVLSDTHAQLIKRVERMRWIVEEQLRLLPENKGTVAANS